MPMVALMLLVPVYLVISDFNRDRPQHAPELALDRLVPLIPGWSIVYGALYLFLILLPVFVIRQEGHIRRTFVAYVAVWLIAYAWFLAYPTIAPRPASVIGDGFGEWGLRALYGSDPPRNCFPSLHVAHSFVSALACYRLHRGVGVAAVICASLVAVSTLFTKQHYVADVLAGIPLAFVAYFIFLRTYPREKIPALDRRAAPAVAVGVLTLPILSVIGSWIVYKWVA